MQRIRRLILLLAFAALGLHAAQPTRLEPKPGDHVALVGGAFADRLQHSGHFEALLHARYPEHQLVVRNLAAAGDEVATRHRSENFGSPDDWLGRVGADVVLAFFGYNEAFAGEAGLAKFRSDLDTYVKHLRSTDFSGRGAPRVVLFSPVADERHPDPNFPDPTPQNTRLRAYAAVIAEVAAANEVQYVDLLGPSARLLAAAAAEGVALTVNGHYLTDEGDRRMAPVLFQGLLGEPAPDLALGRLRAAVNEKNHQWHQRYRTIDGYNVYGGRSALAYRPDQGQFISDRNAPEPYTSNYKVMQQEMAVRDILTANRDRRVWGVAQGGDPEIDDSNLPPVEAVPTNKQGPGPEGAHVFLGGEEAISRMTVHSGMKVNLYASEEQFPELINPVQMQWDTRGRLWVATWPNYPERSPDSVVGDSLLVFEDLNGDGRADRCVHFSDDLNAPTGFQFYQDGVLVVQAPDVWFLRDTDGDGRADWRERVLMGLDSADSHHTANAICYEPGGAIYLSDGVFHRTQVETAYGVVRNNDAAIYRFEPRTGKFETHIAYGFANPHGRVFDRWGNDLVTDATGNNTYFGPAFSGRLDYPAKHPGMKQFWDRPSRPCPGTGILSSRHFPEEFQGNFLNINVISFQGIFRVKVSEEGSGLTGETLENLVSSTDPNFRPSAVSIGADGAIYFTDWHNPIIGHMQHHLRDPSRDKRHGRVYRMTYEGRPLLKAPKIHDQPIPALLELLKSPEDGTRELARLELGRHDGQAVADAARRWAAALDRKDPAFAHHLSEALWVCQGMNVVAVDLLDQVLALSDHNARAAAARVLCYWRDRVPDALARFARLAVDDHPRVRLEAVRAASFFRDAAAADVALLALQKPTDYYLNYTLGETLRQLEPVWRAAIAAGRPVAKDNPAGLAHLIGRVNTAELLKLPRTAAVLEAILQRADAPDAERTVALGELAVERGTSRVAALLGAIDRASESNAATATSLSRLLPMESPAELKAARTQVLRLATDGPTPELRAAGWSALAVGDDSFGPGWELARTDASRLAAWLAGIPLALNPEFRATAYDRVRPLLQGPPAGVVPGTGAGEGRFVRIELPRRGTLTLAEVQVFSGGRNVAPQGTARQSSEAHGGGAARAIDGRTDGDYASGTQTHTQENETNPWWEVDLGANRAIDSVVVWNRSEQNGAYVKRLDGFTLTLLDGSRRQVFQQTGIPAPTEQVRLAVGADPVGAIRRGAIRALVGMGREPSAVFEALTGLIEKGDLVTAAAQGLRILPQSAWPAAPAGRAARALAAWAKSIPAGERTAQDYVETVQLAGELAGSLPAADAAAVRRDLREVRVAVFVLRTVREEMRYDTRRLVVEAGKPFEIILENDDFMPHNLVIAGPGSRERLGNAAALMTPDQLDRRGRAYIPRDDSILAATRLLEAGQRETLQLTAPSVEGEYDYVCTFPGHWTGMWGTLVVTRDVDAYLAAHPRPSEP